MTPRHRRVIVGGDVRGYFRGDLVDVWERYVPVPESVTSVTSVTYGGVVTDVTDVTVPQTQPLPFDDEMPV